MKLWLVQWYIVQASGVTRHRFLNRKVPKVKSYHFKGDQGGMKGSRSVCILHATSVNIPGKNAESPNVRINLHPVLYEKWLGKRENN